ncbi:S-layer homology domain-containing protein [Thiolapillus brandeum]|uniref:SLH domain-containing protein n=1 Tax=Thiolapillus brandeum TaxID=1076588 RepID=A0A7U6JJL3_9GAMM|nr:S-layer homology domain-containing protein [Thiolapillus brandeum]BAO45667.1 hypothetical protein TBH_C2766 [Thiolapillus brandeum]
MNKLATKNTILLTSTLLAMGSTFAGINDIKAPESPSVAVNTGIGIQPKAFGGTGQYTAIHASRWQPWNKTANPEYYGGTGYIGPTNTNSAYYWTQIDLPNGAMVDYVYAVVYDNDANARWNFDISGYEGAVSFGSTPSYKSFGTGTTDTAGTPGYTTIPITLTTPFVVREWADMNGDGIENINSFNLDLYTTQVDGTDTMRFWGAAVRWQRTISPAPATATFSDVPTDHWAFQQIEALADSEITNGCGGGNFCPDTAVTRAQMAVFLSKALGLHWPL